MIPELGHYALVLALALGIVQSVVPLVGALRRDIALMRLATSTALVQFLFVAISFVALTICYVTSDFSVLNVFENSHSMMPLIYKFTSVWGNHEGSMLLWVLILAAFGASVRPSAAICRRRSRPTCWRCKRGSLVRSICSSFSPRIHSSALRNRRSRAATSIRSCRTLASRCIRRFSISAMSASRSHSPSPLPR